MQYFAKVKEALKKVYYFKKYFLITFFVSFILFLFNILISNYKIIISSFSFLLVFSLFLGTLSSIATTSLIMLIIMSALAGIVLSMSLFLLKRQVNSSIGAGSSSLFVSIIVPTCPSCAIGLLSVLGLGGFLAILPFKGLELGILGIILLLFSIIYLSEKITSTVCKI